MENFMITQNQMAIEQDGSGYSFWVRSHETDFLSVVEQTIDALKTEGFGVLTDIDVQAVMKIKLQIDVAPYRILGACNPSLAHRAITAEPNIGLLLPCNVVVRTETDGSIIVAFMNPVAVLKLTSNSEVANVARNVHERLMRVRALIASPVSDSQVHGNASTTVSKRPA
jgi:uncharacterized protein (DUF302 family)